MSAYTLGNKSDSTAIMDELKNSKVQEQVAKGKSDEDAKKEAYSKLRTTMRALLREDYLKARNNYYHGDHNDADYETISLITSFMTKSGSGKPSVQDTLDKWVEGRRGKSTRGKQNHERIPANRGVQSVELHGRYSE